jgi:hypothetical protein
LAHEVYLTDRLDNRSRDRLPHLRCVCFLRPLEASLTALEAELRAPKYGSYYLCQSVNTFLCALSPSNLIADWIDFSNTLSKAAIERLAEADEFELVQEVQVRVSFYLVTQFV